MAPKHGYAAFAPGDVEDAKRGRPDVDLAPYASSRGLTPLGSVQASVVRAVQPDWPDYIFNVVRGVLPGGGYGVIEHELFEIGTNASRGIEFGGAFHSPRYTVKGPKGLLNKILPFELSVDEPTGPFAASAVWVPVTTAAIRVPEAALLPRLLIRRTDRMGALGNTKLDEYHLPGFRLAGTQVPAELRAGIFGGALPHVLDGLSHPYVEVLFTYGTLALRCNGYLRADADLDALASAASAIADGLRTAAAVFHQPRAFDMALAPFDTGRPDWAPWYPVVNDRWRTRFQALADEHGMMLEEPADLHRAFPSLPVPGLAQGVLRGRLPGTDLDGRLVFTGQGRGTEGQVRGAVLLPAPAGTTTLPTGGVLVDDTDMFVEVADDVVACWNRIRSETSLDAEALGPRAVATHTKAL